MTKAQATKIIEDSIDGFFYGHMQDAYDYDGYADPQEVKHRLLDEGPVYLEDDEEVIEAMDYLDSLPGTDAATVFYMGVENVAATYDVWDAWE